MKFRIIVIFAISLSITACAGMSDDDDSVNRQTKQDGNDPVDPEKGSPGEETIDKHPTDPALPEEIADITDTEECEDLNATRAPDVKQAYKDAKAFSDGNVESLANGLADADLQEIPDSLLIRIEDLSDSGPFDDNTVSAKEVGGDGTIIDNFGISDFGLPGTIYEVMSSTLTQSEEGPSGVDFSSKKYFVLLARHRGDVCGGPKGYEFLPLIPEPAFAQSTVDGKFYNVDYTVDKNEHETVNTCTVDDGNRCDAEPVTTYTVVQIDDVAEYAGKTSVVYSADGISIYRRIVNTH